MCSVAECLVILPNTVIGEYLLEIAIIKKHMKLRADSKELKQEWIDAARISGILGADNTRASAPQKSHSTRSHPHSTNSTALHRSMSDMPSATQEHTELPNFGLPTMSNFGDLDLSFNISNSGSRPTTTTTTTTTLSSVTAPDKKEPKESNSSVVPTSSPSPPHHSDSCLLFLRGARVACDRRYLLLKAHSWPLIPWMSYIRCRLQRI